MRLSSALVTAIPHDLEVITAPYDWSPDDANVFQPDILVIPRETPGDAKFVRGAPALAVEVLSPSTRLYDRNTKRAAYAEAGLAWLWIVDPDVPSIDVYGRGQEGSAAVDDLVVVVSASGATELAATAPLPFSVVPATLVDE